MQGQKTGENIETNNLLKQLLKSQQPIQQPLYYINPNRDNISEFKNESNNTLLQDINRDDNIDAAEKANRDDIDEQEDFINAPNIINESQSQSQPPKKKPGRKPGTKNRSAREIDIEKYDKEQNRIQTRKMKIEFNKSKEI